MEPETTSPVPTVTQDRAGFRLIWLLVLLALFLWHGWLILSLFGPGNPWPHLLSDEPILSGRHPLHLYHGYLGAQSFFHWGRSCCFDPHFQAGYPKTPVFDSGSRPAELFLILGGGTYSPAAYKLGLALCCLLAPLLLLVAARGTGLSWGGACLASALGVLIWWSKPCREALTIGDMDLLLAALAALAQFGFLLRFDRLPGVVSWLGILATGHLAWFAHPLFSVVLVPLALVYYLSVGPRHGLFWHGALLTAVVGAAASNLFWLRHWLDYWWIRVPLQTGAGILPHRTFQTLWSAPLWGDAADRFLALFLMGSSLVGVLLLNRARQRAAARLLGLGTLTFLILAILGITLESVSRLGTPHLLTPALLFAAVPAAQALATGWSRISCLAGGPWRGGLITVGWVVAVACAGPEPLRTLAGRYYTSRPFVFDLGADKEAVIAALREQTTTQARILWENQSGAGEPSFWTALLPLLTEDGSGTRRSFLGGLDPAGTIEHSFAGLGDQVLAGRHISQWRDEELRHYCRRYNVGWIVCWSEAARNRFQAWKDAVPQLSLHETGPGSLLAVKRPYSFALKGQATLLRADHEQVALADVIPEEGTVVLSLHYQAGMKASPSRVSVERELDPIDPIPFVRLRLPHPMSRVTLTWENP